MNATLAFNLRLISVIVWNTGISVIVYRIGRGIYPKWSLRMIFVYLMVVVVFTMPCFVILTFDCVYYYYQRLEEEVLTTGNVSES